jgi:hypothetical protein
MRDKEYQVSEAMAIKAVAERSGIAPAIDIEPV